MNMKLTFKMI